MCLMCVCCRVAMKAPEALQALRALQALHRDGLDVRKPVLGLAPTDLPDDERSCHEEPGPLCGSLREFCTR